MNHSDRVTIDDAAVVRCNEREHNALSWELFNDFLSNEILKCNNHGDWTSTLTRIERRAMKQLLGAEAMLAEALGEAFCVE